MGCPGLAARAQVAPAPAANIVFKQVRRFIFSPLAHRRSLIKLLLTRYGVLDPVQAGTSSNVERLPIIAPIAVCRNLLHLNRAQVLSRRREHPNPSRTGCPKVAFFRSEEHT